MTLEEFQSNAVEIRQKVLNRYDTRDYDNGILLIYSENLNKYLEEYACKDAEDLEDTLWHSYGIYVKIID